MLRACCRPTRAGSLYVAPAPGIMPRRVSGNPSSAVEAATRKVVHKASSSPPPRATPFIAAMVGIGKDAS
jgi:hypothetical protein